MKTALLDEGGKDRELILIVSRAEFLTIFGALEEAARAHRRTRRFKTLVSQMEKAPVR